MVQYRTSKNARIDPFDAVSDPTRRGILERLGRRDASISELAEAFDMTLTGM
jgi:DNA-binding transcriptional ArsR family regulator